MAKVTERELVNLKESASKIRDQIIAAKSTMVEVDKNIENYEGDLAQLGTTYEKSAETIATLEAQAEELYNASKAIIDEYLKI
jgi:septal ring factor EnvC (AmiA/AmiB activator)